MFVFSDGSADLFILYPPGARGDFLAAILKDYLHKQYKNFTINSPNNYQKAHWFDDIRVAPIGQFKTKIRIRLSDIEEYLTTVHLWQLKIHAEAWSGILERLMYNETNFDSSVDSLFDYVIDFKNLYSVECIHDLYQKINNRKLSDDALREIQYNIDLQPWVTLSKTLYNSSNPPTIMF